MDRSSICSKSSEGLNQATTSSVPSTAPFSPTALARTDSAASIARKTRSESFRARQRSLIELAKDPSIRRQREKHLQEYSSAEHFSRDYLPEQSASINPLRWLRYFIGNLIPSLGIGNNSRTSESDGNNPDSSIPSATKLTRNSAGEMQEKSGSSSTHFSHCSSKGGPEAITANIGSSSGTSHSTRKKFNFEDRSLEIQFENRQKVTIRAIKKSKEQARLKYDAQRKGNGKADRFRIHITPEKQKLAFSHQSSLMNLKAGEYVDESGLSFPEYVVAKKECEIHIRRWEKVNKLTDPIAAHFKNYRLRWNHILMPSSAPRITFSSIPWPTLTTLRTSADITKEGVKNYLLLARFGPNRTVNIQRKKLALEELDYWDTTVFPFEIVPRIDDKNELKEINAAALTVRSVLLELCDL